MVVIEEEEDKYSNEEEYGAPAFSRAQGEERAQGREHGYFAVLPQEDGAQWPTESQPERPQHTSTAHQHRILDDAYPLHAKRETSMLAMSSVSTATQHVSMGTQPISQLPLATQPISMATDWSRGSPWPC